MLRAMAHPSAAHAPTVLDPVCGMTVDPATANEKVEHLGTTYYFCSAGCREAFQKDPGRYLARVPQSGHTGHGGHSH